ncbi:MAG: hypothetical protein M3081_17875 [Gemmatimonadota bacterium]|nr:hypothetical protein [Gemmatimonadota bacterium]
MALWDKVKQELDRAGRAAQSAIDEGKLRLDALRARQLADKAAQALGYAVYRARLSGGEVDADAYSRLSSTLASHEAEAKKLEDRLDDMIRSRKTDRTAKSDVATYDTSATASEPPAQTETASAPNTGGL